ncbi:lyase family protein [Psychrobacter sp. LV10R520-6]|uniref:lyase family protein n=1 Tax=Psychrobacter sp. LV10R520-6 TaxID=1415574 RepID=UPI0024CC9E88|nr:lyase family protein [Psychrobacter sp. LV10R520-6]SNT70471.1 3-carboxy-cis,cis-muconate cycloisomerase [Psychrobacter sp. LV10R520-6]
MKVAQLINQPFVHPDIAQDFSARFFVKAMLDFELAIIEVRENNGLVPDKTLQKSKQALTLDLFDIDAIGAETYLGGNAAIPFVAQAKALLPQEIKPYFHQTVTSQDVIDTAMMLMLKPALKHINQDLIDVLKACGILIENHRATPMAGRTLMQQALPITFGAKISQWASSLIAVIPNLAKLERSGFYLQWGGPVGVSNVDNENYELPQQVAELLGLSTPLLPWHTNRQPIHAIASTLDACAGAMENIVEDIALMCQSELGEVAEPAIKGMGGSSSMPHKRNPVLCALIKTATLRMHGHLSVISNTTAQPFERALGQWHATWVPLTEGVALVAGATAYLKTLLHGLQVYPERMAANLDLNSDAYLVENLKQHFSTDQDQLYPLIEQASQEAHVNHQGFSRIFLALLAKQPINLDGNSGELETILSPLTYCGAADRQCQVTLEAIDKLILLLAI